MFHFHRLIKQCSLLILLCLPAFYALGDEDLPEVEIIKTSDFSKLSQVANDQQKLIMLEVSATYCSFCRKLEEEIKGMEVEI